MHYHCEIVMPPTADIEAAVDAVLRPFDENTDSEDGNKHAFWDFWVIGGRWAGAKMMAGFDPARVEQFMDWCQTEGVTVSGLRAGKQALSPKEQIPKVDAKWNEMFPSVPPVPCPIFAHSNDQYGKWPDGSMQQDVCRLADVPAQLKCSHVIFAGPSYSDDGKDYTGPPEAKFMMTEDAWNGCNHLKVDWDGTFSAALAKYRENLKNRSESYAEKVTPTDDWIVVTVDYHS